MMNDTAAHTLTLPQRSAQVEMNVYPRLEFVPVRGAGCYLYDEAGDRYLDLYAGHAVASTGHCHPHVVTAVQEQVGQLLFYSNAVHNEARIEAAELLVKHAPTPGSKVFFCCSGAEANDNAIKIARKVTGRRKVISFENSFHGRTIGTLSAAGLEKYRQSAGPALVDAHVHVPFDDEAALRAVVDSDTAAIMVEAIQSLAGVYTAEPAFHQLIARLAQEVGAAVIFDEVQTAFGRCGTFFYAESVGIQPDLVTTAKGIASGIPVGVVMATPQFADALQPGDQGSTFGGGPVSMAAMRATLEVIAREDLPANATERGAWLIEQLQAIPQIIAVRGQGLLLGIDFGKPAKPVQQALYQQRILVGSTANPNTMRLLPPLVLTQEHCETFIACLKQILAGDPWSTA
jgi:acetylornithine/N-succinyldiaminopimelate aminotransferase